MQDSYRCSTKAGSQSTNCAANCLQSHIFRKLNIFDNQIKSIQNKEHNQPIVPPIACNLNIFRKSNVDSKPNMFGNQIKKSPEELRRHAPTKVYPFLLLTLVTL